MSCCPALTVWCVPTPRTIRCCSCVRALRPTSPTCCNPAWQVVEDTAAAVDAHNMQLLLSANSRRTAAVCVRPQTPSCSQATAATLPMGCIERACIHTNSIALCALVKQNSAPAHTHPPPGSSSHWECQGGLELTKSIAYAQRCGQSPSFAVLHTPATACISCRTHLCAACIPVDKGELCCGSRPLPPLC